MDNTDAYNLMFDGRVLLSIPWDMYVATVWVMHTSTQSVAAVLTRKPSDPPENLRLEFGILVNGAPSALRELRRLSNINGSEEVHVNSAHKALVEYAKHIGTDVHRIDVRGSTRQMDQIIEAVTAIELGYAVPEA